ncbi:MAG: hypothetical protein N4A38_03875 [Candidatus Gracilibacteria bacterium]|nr:hypothetical protein [Candidatus Gracilibacteria bacterium]
MLKPGLAIKSGAFSAGKTSNSIGDARKFNPFNQINITNQPSGYTHIYIKTAKDFVNLVKDIYYYNLYYCGYDEKMEQLNLYKEALYNLEHFEYKDLFSNAINLVKQNNFFKDLWTKFKIRIGKEKVCVMMKKQLIKEINFLENDYLAKRKKFTDVYGENLILDYFNYISLDEATLYFGARNFKENFSGENAFLLDFIVFPVKLNTRIEAIVQNPNMLDINFRRQASTYKTHLAKFGGFLKRTSELEVKDPEKVRFEDADIVSSSLSVNTYKIFKYPKIQYYRNHLISSRDKSLYEPGMYFEHIRNMTDFQNGTPPTQFIEEEKKEQEAPKIILNPIG